MTQERIRKASNWTQSGLLTIIVVMMGWFMVDFSAWKDDITEALKHNNVDHVNLNNSINNHVTEELIKNNKQDIIINQNTLRIDVLEDKVGLY